MAVGPLVTTGSEFDNIQQHDFEKKLLDANVHPDYEKLGKVPHSGSVCPSSGSSNSLQG